METRRIVFGIQVAYEISKRQLLAVPAILREIVEAQPLAEFDRAHFKSCGSFALEFETVYYVKTPDHAACMDIQQAINVALFERFEQEGISFAYPTQTVYIANARNGAGTKAEEAGTS